MDCTVAALTMVAALAIVVHAHDGSATSPRGSLVVDLGAADR